jgi:hypothetical protein
MTDPIYQYVKGEGWVPTTYGPDVRFVKLGDGRHFKLTLRKPVSGEYVMQIGQYKPKLTQPDRVTGESLVNMDAVVNWFMEKRPRLRSFYLVPRWGYIHEHHTVVVENA